MPSLRDGREHLAHLREEAQMADAEGEDRKRGESDPEKKGNVKKFVTKYSEAETNQTGFHQLLER